MIATHKIEELTFDNNYMFLKVDGKTLMIPLNKASKKLLEANDIQKGIYKISASGYGIHWPLIDEDLAVESLIKTSKL